MNIAAIAPPEKSKKEVRQMVYNKLSGALDEFKVLFKKKNFDDKMLTATKMFADDIIRSNRKARRKDKKLAKKEVQNKTKSKKSAETSPAE
ncbi:MAG TPA: hypothetical protein VF476_15265 [Chitinophagaceae bacterium]